jgi:hypothetical protein
MTGVWRFFPTLTGYALGQISLSTLKKIGLKKKELTDSERVQREERLPQQTQASF